MCFKNKLYKYQQKNKLLFGGSSNEEKITAFLNLYDEYIANPQSVSKDIAIALNSLIRQNKLRWLHIPTVDDIGHDIFSYETNIFNVTEYWHKTSLPHDKSQFKRYYPDKEYVLDENCPGCLTSNKFDKRTSVENPLVSHHVDQHLFRISRDYLYTYNLVTCSCIILIQNDVVGMMHIDSYSHPLDIREFIHEFSNEVGTIDHNLKIYGFLNNEIFDEINKYQLTPIYELIVSQYKKYFQNVFNNISINLPTHATDKVMTSQGLYIFAIPRIGVKGFLANATSKMPKYYHSIYYLSNYIYEQQLARPSIIVDRLKKALSNELLLELARFVGTRGLEDTELIEGLSYLIVPDTSDIDEILRVKEFLETRGYTPNLFLLEKQF